MADIPEKLKLGKGAAFVKSALRRLAVSDEIWEADIRPAPASGNNGTIWQGLVISHDGGFLNERMFEGPATVNDMARLLADTMRRALDGNPRRPRTLRIRKRLQWVQLLPHLEELGIQVVSAPRLAKWDHAFNDFCRNVWKAKSKSLQPGIEKLYPAIAEYISTRGDIEIGDQEGFGFCARALDYGGLVFETKK